MNDFYKEGLKINKYFGINPLLETNSRKRKSYLKKLTRKGLIRKLNEQTIICLLLNQRNKQLQQMSSGLVFSSIVRDMYSKEGKK